MSKFKIWILRRIGNEIGENVQLGPALVINCGRFMLADDSVIFGMNLFRNLAAVKMGKRAIIGQLNQFTAAPLYQRASFRAGFLSLEEHAGITNRHYVDCSGQVLLRPYAAIGGVQTTVLSHQIDLQQNRMSVGKIVVDENAIAVTRCVLLMDSHLPPRSVLGAHSLLMKFPADHEGKSGLYAGSPAQFIHGLEEFTWWNRDTWLTTETAFDDSTFDPIP
jgi:acetyltransferase-like isoleucine patch superfamily enzyme